MEWLKKSKGRLAVAAFFALLLLYGILAHDDYGITYDDPYQRAHSLTTYNQLFLQEKTYKTDCIDTDTLSDGYSGNYGVIMQLPAVFMEELDGFEHTRLEAYQIRHLYVFIWFFIGSIYFYHLCMLITGRKRLLSLLGTVMLVISPRILADGCYNIKDSLCMSLFIISAYYGLKFLRKETILSIIPFIVFTALCSTTRVIGALVIAAGMIVFFFKTLTEGHLRRFWAYCISISILFLGAYFIMSPDTWAHPVQSLLQAIEAFSDYTTWQGNVFYLGEWHNGQELPWHYLLVWIGITVPTVYLLFFAFGLASRMKETVIAIRNKEIDSRAWDFLYFFLIFLLPVAYVIIMTPTLYNGWRHFYFLYPIIIIIAVMGLEKLTASEKLICRRGAFAALGLSICSTVGWMAINHPYEYMYFSPLVRDYAYTHFDRDYWGMAEVECFEYLYDYDIEERPALYIRSYSTNYNELNNSESPITFYTAANYYKADYVVSDWHEFEQSYLFKCIKSVDVDGYTIRNLWRRIYDVGTQLTLEQHENGEFSYSAGYGEWTKSETEGTIQYTLELSRTIPTDEVAVFTSYTDMASEMDVLVSGDGEGWMILSQSPNAKLRENRQSADCIVHNLNYIRIVVPKEFQYQECQFQIELCGTEETLAQYSEPGYIPIVGFTSSEESSEEEYKLAWDNDTTTAWRTSTQYAGQFYQVEFDNVYRLDGINLVMGDRPQNIEIYASLNGEDWERLEIKETEETDGLTNYSFAPAECRYIRIQAGETETVAIGWYIYEMTPLAADD